MTTTTTSAALIPVAPVFTNTERLALAGFLAGYGGLTREAYELDLHQYPSWCHQHHLRLFQARRADIKCFSRDLEVRGRARATITRRLCTVAGSTGMRWRKTFLIRASASRGARSGAWAVALRKAVDAGVGIGVDEADGKALAVIEVVEGQLRPGWHQCGVDYHHSIGGYRIPTGTLGHRGAVWELVGDHPVRRVRRGL